jgi:hypothetical protein
MRRNLAAALGGTVAAAVLLAACGGADNRPLTVGAARTYTLDGFRPGMPAKAGVPTTIAFAIRQPDGTPLAAYRRGAGPHTGIHLILVRSDLGTIIHRHPPISANGRLRTTIVLPTPGRYRVVVDAYPASGAQPNFQLFSTIRATGAAPHLRLPKFQREQTVDGYRVRISGTGRVRAVQPASLTANVTDPRGRPARFRTLYGATAHAIFFRQGTLDYFHTHVCARGASGCASAFGGATVTGRSSKPGTLQIGVLLPVAGTWRLFLQCDVGGRVLTVPVTLKAGS